MNIPRVIPKPSISNMSSDLHEEVSSQQNGCFGHISNPGHQMAAGIQGGKNRKTAFNGAFKQAVFMNRDGENGSSRLQVSFTSDRSRLAKPDVPKQQLGVHVPANVVVQRNKPKVGKLLS